MNLYCTLFLYHVYVKGYQCAWVHGSMFVCVYVHAHLHLILRSISFILAINIAFLCMYAIIVH